MRQRFTVADFQPLAAKVAAELVAAHDEITALDAATGDGDLGVTCRLGMQAVIDSPGEAAGSLADALLKAGMAFNSAGASTFGALVATAAMKAAKVAKDGGLAEWDLSGIIAAGEAAIAGLQQRGGAALGDKTLLDALIPAVEALKSAQAEGASLAVAFTAAAVAAQAGAESTTPLQGKFGRSAWFQERSIGVQDAGATVVAVAARAIADYVRE
ncbi:MAG: DAK2 domain-containing protein [Armatimonadetes bacterium]|nr:DAK2 domain-containing protein [Armatimonadota bacterium]